MRVVFVNGPNGVGSGSFFVGTGGRARALSNPLVDREVGPRC